MIAQFIQKTSIKNSDGSFKSEFKCFCGNNFFALPREIRSGKTKSCGCLRKSLIGKHSKGRTPKNALNEKWKSAFNGLLHSYKKSAKHKKLEFLLTPDEFFKITKSECHYCGAAPSKPHFQTSYCREPYVYNGIDRIINTVGYIQGNVVGCCAECNYLKSATSYEAFVKRIESIYLNLKSNGRWNGEVP